MSITFGLTVSVFHKFDLEVLLPQLPTTTVELDWTFHFGQPFRYPLNSSNTSKIILLTPQAINNVGFGVIFRSRQTKLPKLNLFATGRSLRYSLFVIHQVPTHIKLGPQGPKPTLEFLFCVSFINVLKNGRIDRTNLATSFRRSGEF